MKKTILILLVAGFPALLHAQHDAYQSVLSIFEPTDIEMEMVEETRNFMIGSDKIMVSPYGDDRLYLTVNRIEKKERVFNGMATWYYCQDDKKNSRTGEPTQFIVIVPDSKRMIEVYQVLDEVTYIKNQFILN